MNDHQKFAIIVHAAQRAEQLSVKMLCHKSGMNMSSMYRFLGGRGHVTKKFFSRMVRVFPLLDGMGNFPAKTGSGPRVLQLNEKGLAHFETLRQQGNALPFAPQNGPNQLKSQPKKTEKKSKIIRQMSVPQAARTSRSARPTELPAPAMPLTVVGGLLKLLQDTRLTAQIIEMNDWAKDQGTTLGDVLRAVQA